MAKIRQPMKIWPQNSQRWRLAAYLKHQRKPLAKAESYRWRSNGGESGVKYGWRIMAANLAASKKRLAGIAGGGSYIGIAGGGNDARR
jgi:hypothetical protein